MLSSFQILFHFFSLLRTGKLSSYVIQRKKCCSHVNLICVVGKNLQFCVNFAVKLIGYSSWFFFFVMSYKYQHSWCELQNEGENMLF